MSNASEESPISRRAFIAVTAPLALIDGSAPSQPPKPTASHFRSALAWIPQELHSAIASQSPTAGKPLDEYLQAAIDDCRRDRAALHFPPGLYRIASPLKCYGDEDSGATVLQGDSEYTSIIYQQSADKDILTNDRTKNNFSRLTLRNIALRGGSWALNISRDGDQVSSLLHMQNVRLEFQTNGGLRNDQYLISCLLDNIVFFYCHRAIYNGRNANNVSLIKPRFEGLDETVIELASPGGSVNGCENFRLFDPRFEGRNAPGISGKRVIKGYRLSNLVVDGGYFEDTHRTILEETGSLGLVRFRDVHFTGQENAVGGKGFKQEIFLSDGIVTFESCRFVTGSYGAPKMRLMGENLGLSDERSHVWRISASGSSLTTRYLDLTAEQPQALFVVMPPKAPLGAAAGKMIAQPLSLELLVEGVAENGRPFFGAHKGELLVSMRDGQLHTTQRPGTALISGSENIGVDFLIQNGSSIPEAMATICVFLRGVAKAGTSLRAQVCIPALGLGSDDQLTIAPASI